MERAFTPIHLMSRTKANVMREGHFYIRDLSKLCTKNRGSRFSSCSRWWCVFCKD